MRSHGDWWCSIDISDYIIYRETTMLCEAKERANIGTDSDMEPCHAWALPIYILKERRRYEHALEVIAHSRKH